MSVRTANFVECNLRTKIRKVFIVLTYFVLWTVWT